MLVVQGGFLTMRLLAAKTVPFMAGLRVARGVSPAVLAALLAAAALLAIGAPLFASLSHRNLDPASLNHAGPITQAKLGSETVMPKFVDDEAEAAIEAAKPPPLSRLMAMALTPTPAETPTPQGQPQEQKEPNLSGLSDIPRELIWNRKPDKAKATPKAFAAFSKASENLPWDAVEPVPFAPVAPPAKAALTQAPGVKQTAALQPLTLPDDGQIKTWLKTKVTEIKGTERERPLYHFELWLEPPAAVKRRLLGVAYAFSSPAVMPQEQASGDQASGFRISAGGLACADEITLTLTFDDGQSEKVTVDGCKLFG